MHCPSCNADQPSGATRCAACHLTYHRGLLSLTPELPPIRVGGPIVRCDLSKEPPPGQASRDFKFPGGDSVRGTGSGCEVLVVPGRSLDLQHGMVRVRDGCVKTEVTAVDEGVVVSALFRISVIEHAWLYYAFEIDPAERRARLALRLSGPRTSNSKPIVDWHKSGHIGGMGVSNVIELRAMGPTLEGWVNGERLIATHDAVLGTGTAGVRIDHAPDQPAKPRRAHVSYLDLWQVAQ